MEFMSKCASFVKVLKEKINAKRNVLLTTTQKNLAEFVHHVITNAKVVLAPRRRTVSNVKI